MPFKKSLLTLTFTLILGGCDNGSSDAIDAKAINSIKYGDSSSSERLNPTDIKQESVDSSPVHVNADGFYPPPSPESRLRKKFRNQHLYAPMINTISKKWGIEPYFTHAIISQESGYNPTIGSPAGAVGLMQLISSTGIKFGCNNRKNPRCNVNAGVRYLKHLANRFHGQGNIQTIAAGYNAGGGVAASYLNGTRLKGKNPRGRKTPNGVPTASFGYNKTQKRICSGVNNSPGYKCEGETYKYARNVAAYYVRYKRNPSLIKMSSHNNSRRPSALARDRGRLL